MKWLSRVSYPMVAGRLNLAVMGTAYIIFGLSLIFQAHRWASTPAYHLLLQILTARTWGALFLGAGTAMAYGAWRFRRRPVTAALVAAFTLTSGWMLAFIVRYLSSPDTTPETWVSWAVFGYLLLKVAISLDRPRESPAAGGPAAAAFRQAVSDALSAAEQDRKAALARALDAGSGQLRDTVAAACTAYAQTLHATVPAPGTSGGDPVFRQALGEARTALLRAEEAYAKAAARTPRHRDTS